MMIQGCLYGKQNTRSDVSPAQDYGRHGNSTTSLFLIDPGLSLRIHLNTRSRQLLLINGHWLIRSEQNRGMQQPLQD